MKNQKNNKEQVNFTNPIFDEISKLVKDTLDIWKLQSLEKKLSFNEAIFEIIKQDKTNRNLALFLISEVSSDFFKRFDYLHLDKEVVKLAISKDSSLFYSISNELKTDPEIWLYVIKSMIREWKNFLEVEKFVDVFFPKSKNFLLSKYKQELWKTINT